LAVLVERTDPGGVSRGASRGTPRGVARGVARGVTHPAAADAPSATDDADAELAFLRNKAIAYDPKAKHAEIKVACHGPFTRCATYFSAGNATRSEVACVTELVVLE